MKLVKLDQSFSIFSVHTNYLEILIKEESDQQSLPRVRDSVFPSSSYVMPVMLIYRLYFE